MIDMFLYRCRQCTRQFYSTEKDPFCSVCGIQATLSECQDTDRNEANLRDELISARRTIYALVKAAGGRVELSFRDIDSAMRPGATLECHYDHITNRQILNVR